MALMKLRQTYWSPPESELFHAIVCHVGPTLLIAYGNTELVTEACEYMHNLQQVFVRYSPAPVYSSVQVMKKLNLRAQVLFVEDPSLESRYALFCEDIQGEDLRRDDASLTEGQIVAARHQNSWQRAYLLCHLQLSEKVYLVYLLDVGSIIFCSELRYLPAPLMIEEPRLHLLECASKSSGDLKISEDAQLSTLNLDKAYHVKVLNPQQLFSNCDYGFWVEELKHGDKVNIVSVETVNKFWVAGNLDLLREVLERLALSCEPWVPSVETKDWEEQLVVAHTKTAEGTSYYLRGHITCMYEESSLGMLDIDTQANVIVHANDVKRASDLVRALPAKVGFFELHMKGTELTALKMRKALDTLKKMARDKTELELVLMDKGTVEVDMLYYDENDTCHLLSDLIFGEAIPQHTPQNNYYSIQQLAKLPLSEGPVQCLYVKDASELEKRILSVACFNKSLMETYNLQDIAIDEHCERAKATCPGYKPRYCYKQ